MSNNTQFSIAVHIMTGLGYKDGADMTSSSLAKSVNTCPSFVRRVLSKLSKAGLVHTTIGKAGACTLAKKASEISLFDIYEAVDAPKAFAIHGYDVQKPCPVSCNIKTALERVLGKTQLSVEESLKSITLEEVISDVKRE